MSSTGPPEAVREPHEPSPELAERLERLEVPAPRAEHPGRAPVETASAVVPPRWGLGAYLLAEAVFLGVSVSLILPSRLAHRPPSADVLLLSAVVPTVLAAAVAILATVVRGNGPRADLALHFEWADVLRGLRFGGAGLLVTIPAASLWATVVGPAKANSAVGEAFAGLRLSPVLAVLVFLVVWLVAPVCEEIVYRGLLWGAMERLGATGWWAFGLTTLCFALAHFEFARTPLLLVVAVPIGLARLFTGRLTAGIVAHQLNNLLPAAALLMMMLGHLRP